MEKLIRIGHSLSPIDAVKWEESRENRMLESAYIESTGMEYEFLDNPGWFGIIEGYGVLAAWSDGVGLVTYYCATREFWQELLDSI